MVFKNFLKKSKLKSLLREENAQISLELIIIVGVVILVALIVGIFLKQTSINRARDINDYKKSFEG